VLRLPENKKPGVFKPDVGSASYRTNGSTPKNGSVRNTRNTREWMADGITIIRGSHTDNDLRVSETRVVLYYNTLGGGSRL